MRYEPKLNLSRDWKARAWYALDCPPNRRGWRVRVAVLAAVLAALSACQSTAATAPRTPADIADPAGVSRTEPVCVSMTPDASSALASALPGRVDYSHNAWTVDRVRVSAGFVAAEDEPWTACVSTDAGDAWLLAAVQRAAADGRGWVDPA